MTLLPKIRKTVFCHDCKKRVPLLKSKKRGMGWYCRLHFLKRELAAAERELAAAKDSCPS